MKVIDKPVAVLALFSKQGIPKPLIFSITEEDEMHEIKNIKVIRMYDCKINKKKVTIYSCYAVINNIKRNFELRFYPADISWVLYKI